MGKQNSTFRTKLKLKLTKAQIKPKRKKWGRLADNRVTIGVVARYKTAVLTLLSFLSVHKFLPQSFIQLDSCVSEFVEGMWAEGEPHALVTDALAGLQYFVPQFRKHLFLSWRLLNVWEKKEPPKRALPMHPVLLLGMAGMLAYIGATDAVAVLLVGFDTMLRSGELYNLCVKDVSFARERAVLKLRDTKTSSRKSGDEVVVVESSLAVKWLKRACANKGPEDKVLQMGPYTFRRLFNEIKLLLGCPDGISVYSLRRGGATWSFLNHGSMERTLLRGRWSSSATARIYLQDAVAGVSDLKLGNEIRRLLRQYAKQLTL